MYNFADELRDIIITLVVYIASYQPLYDNVITPYLQPYAEPWFYSMFMMVWDRIAIILVGGFLLRGILKAQLQEPRSQIEEVNYY